MGLIGAALAAIAVMLWVFFESQPGAGAGGSPAAAAAGAGGAPASSSDPLVPGPGDAGALDTSTYNPIGAPADGSPGVVTPEKIALLVRGISTAEGAFANAVTPNVPQRANNPGDLTKSWGFPTTGVANKEGVLVFATLADGQAALAAEVTAMLSGSSTVYALDDTFFDVAAKYTGNQNADAWANNCAAVCGVPPSFTLGDFLFA